MVNTLRQCGQDSGTGDTVVVSDLPDDSGDWLLIAKTTLLIEFISSFLFLASFRNLSLRML